MPSNPTVPSSALACNWQALREELLMQWKQLTLRELDRAGPNRHRIAQLIARKYGVSFVLVENYLSNFERTLPMAA